MLGYHIKHKSSDSDWVVFLHGLGGNSDIWYKQIETFKPHFNLLFIDLFGHGKTTDSLDNYSFERLAEEILAVLDYENIESAHFMGISLGSIIADAVSYLSPHRVKSIIMGGAVLGYDLRARFLLQTGRVLKYLMPYMWLYKLFAFIMMPKRNHSKSRRIFVREARKLGGREFRKWYQLMESLTAFYERHKSVVNATPKLYISGAEDHLFLRFVIRNFLQERFSAIHVIEKCGHICNIERHDEFNRISLNYLCHFPNVPALKYVPAGIAAKRIPLEQPAVQKQIWPAPSP